MNAHPLSIGLPFENMDQGWLFGQTNFDEYNQIFWNLGSIVVEFEQVKPNAQWISARLHQLS